MEIAWAADTAYPAILDPLWSSTATMIDAVQKFTATTLSDGTILVAGGLTSTGSTANTEIFDPVSQTWSTASGLRVARHNHTATSLIIRTTDRTGLVLVAGGDSFDGTSRTFPTQTELYDPATGVWTLTTGSLAFPRSNHTTTELPSGMVIAAGGQAGSPPTETGTCEIFNPRTDVWSSTASLAQARFGHTATLIPVAASPVQLLIIGGMKRDGRALATTEVFDPDTRVWRSGLPLATARSFHAATLLYNGRLLVAGGVDYTATPPVYPVAAERLDPAATSWLSAGTLSQGRAALITLQLSNSGVLAAGGFNGSGSDIDVNAVDLYDSSTDSWTTSARMSVGRSFFAANALNDGSVLASGGRSDQVATSTSERFTLGRDGDPCASNIECGSTRCTSGACTCPSGQVYCQALNKCIPTGGCCTANDCTTPFDTCHVTAGASCGDGICSYPILSCPGQACSGGVCVSAPLSLTITSSAAQYGLDPNMFINGRVSFSATLTNVSTMPISVSLYDSSNIGILTLTGGDVALLPNIRPVEIEEDPLVVAAAALSNILAGQSRQFQISALTTISTQGSDYSMSTFLPNGVGTYRVVMSYQYNGPDNGFQNVFHGVLTSNEVSFNAQ